ncbi:hypothetical protein GCM10011342_16550 [Aquisalinus flavus]|uniref:Uncharacterized protein n=1 Tax=Aquisalinus flavus TaxID=1526572 RepID=A0A8J2Y551_9PROT|nr:hypothetical protein GCM10011342_16550 [Aquisalinus flavus]
MPLTAVDSPMPEKARTVSTQAFFKAWRKCLVLDPILGIVRGMVDLICFLRFTIVSVTVSGNDGKTVTDGFAVIIIKNAPEQVWRISFQPQWRSRDALGAGGDQHGGGVTVLGPCLRI